MDRNAALTKRFSQEPLASHLGLSLESLGPGLAAVSMVARPEHCIVGGIVQGGVVTTLADYAGVYAAMTLITDGHTPARHISIELLRKTNEGETLTAHAHVVEATRSTVVVLVNVSGEGSRVRAIAQIVFAKPKP